MSRPHAYLLVPGILYKAQGIDNWPIRARDWIHQHTNHQAFEYTYEAGLIRPKEDRQRWVDDVVGLLCTRYAGRAVSIVAHSNGNEVVCGALKQCPDIHLHSFHMVAAACDADFNVNGLNDALVQGRVRRVFLYCSKGDRTLNTWATWSKRAFGWAGYGFGNLGWVGHKNVRPGVLSAVDELWKDHLDHSDYFTAPFFDELMQRVTMDITQPVPEALPPTPEEQGKPPAELVDIPKPADLKDVT